MSARIAVVVTAHDRADLLDRALRSVEAQTVRDLAIVVVDDASSDATPQVCARHAAADERVQVVRLDDNVGVARARNLGVERSDSEWVAFMDADDHADPTWLEHLLAAAGDADVVKAGYVADVPVGAKTFHATSRPVERALVATPGATDGSVVRPRDFLYAMGFVWNGLYSRAAIKGVEFDPSPSLFEDMVFNLDVMAQVERVAFVPAADYHYVQHSSQRLTSRPQRPDLPFRASFGRRVVEQCETWGLGEVVGPEITSLMGWSLTVECARTAPPGVDPVAEIGAQLATPEVRWLLSTAVDEGLRRVDRPVVTALRAGRVRRARRVARAVERLAGLKARIGLRLVMLRA